MTIELSHNVARQWPELPLRGGAIPYRFDKDGGLEFLLIRRSDRVIWSVPKGKPSAGIPLHLTAATEAFEEAGVEGRIDQVPIGSFLHRKEIGSLFGNPVVEVVTFPLLVTNVHETWPEASIRIRRWVGPKEAKGIVAQGLLPQLLETLEHELAASPAG